MISEKIWALDTSNKVWRLSWTWWWWIFFIDNPHDEAHPKQLMILWSTKDCGSIKIHDAHFSKTREEAGREAGELFKGAVAAWYYDGYRMHDSFILDVCDLSVSNNDSGSILRTIPGEKYIFKCDGDLDTDGCDVIIDKDDIKLDFHMSAAKSGCIKPTESSNRYLGTRFGYDIVRIRRMGLSGTIKEGDKTEGVTGSAYFQKIHVNAPAVPWYWGMVHFKDGSILEYFIPHLGTSILKRRPDDFDNGFGSIPLIRPTVDYYNPHEAQPHRFNQLQFKKEINGATPPIWIGNARSDCGSISFKLDSYSRAYWRFEQPILGRLSSVFHYTEYPVTVSEFKIEIDGSKKSLVDVGHGVGNAEHSWGMLL